MRPGPAGPGPAMVAPPAGIRPARIGADEPVVVRVPDRLGDAVLALPALAAVVEGFDRHPVIVLAHDAVAPLFSGHRGVAEVLRTGGGALESFVRLRRALERRGGGVGLALDGFGSAAALSGAGIVEVWGYGGPLSRLALDVTLPPRWRRGRHRWEAYALLAAAATGAPVAERYPLVAGAGDEAAAATLLEEAAGDGPLVGLAATARSETRGWPAERFASLAGRLGRRGARVVAFGTVEDGALSAALAAADPPPTDLIGRATLPVLAECLRRVDVVVGNDNGPARLAAAVGTPVVALHGGTSVVVDGPRGPLSQAVVHPVPCRPCRRAACAYRLECLAGIRVETVLSLAEARLPARAGAS